MSETPYSPFVGLSCMLLPMPVMSRCSARLKAVTVSVYQDWKQTGEDFGAE